MADKTIGTKLELKGEKEFNQQMKAINNGLKTTRSDMAALSAEFDENADSIQSLTAKQKLLQSSVDQQAAKVETLRAQYEAAAATLGDNAARTQKYKQELNAATVALQKETNALEANAAAMKEKRLASLKAVAAGAKTIFSGIGAAAGGVAKGVGAITAASAVGVAAIGAGGMLALSTMSNMAREAAESAKAAKEAGETLTSTQEQWLAYADQLDTLDASVANAKGALAGVLMPMLGDLSSKGAAFLNDFTADMTAAAGDTGKQTQVLSDYIVKGATLIKEQLPEYIETGKELFSGLAEGLGESGPELLEMGLDLVMELLDGIISHAPELATAGMSLVQSLLDGLLKRGPDVFSGAVDMVVQIVSGLAQAAPQMIPAAAHLIGQLLTALIEASPQLLDAGLELVLGIISGFAAGLGELTGSVEDLVLAILEVFGGADFAQAGKDVIDGIKSGISAAWDGLVSWFNNLWDSLFKNRTATATITGDLEKDGSLARGMDYVPFDGYIAELHRGEAVLTAAEADRYRRGQMIGSHAVQNVYNLTINAKSLTQADLDMLVAYMNGKLGDDLP